jgi:hypothetical protein
MKRVVRFLPLFALLSVSIVCSAGDKKPPASTHIVDSGTFGIFINGRRVGTEKFEISQVGEGNVTRAELKVEDGSNKAAQKSELQLSGAGDLQHYSWNELSPGKAQETVDPNDQFLIERITASPQEKSVEQPFILPKSTAILDDYFFSHRELLAWRYLGANCSRNPAGQTECRLGKTDFGVLIPRQHVSALISMEFKGKEKVTIRGQEVELNRFNMQSDSMDWALWFDDQHRLQRVVIASDATEVLRD